MNSGGPGTSGLGLVHSLAPVLAPEIQQRFDIVGFDP